MNNRDWERFGEDIRKTIQDAVDYGNYDRLNQTITNTVNQVTERIRNSSANANTYTYRQPQYQQQTYTRPIFQTKEMMQRFKSSGGIKVTGLLLAIFGYPMGGLFLLATLASILGGIAGGEIVAGIIATVVFLTLTIVFLYLAFKGSAMLIRGGRFDKYVREIGTAEFCNIRELAYRVNMSQAFVIKDVEKMIRNGWFKQGYLDRSKTCLIVTYQMYQQYCQLEHRKDVQRQEEKQREQQKTQSRQGLSQDVQRVIEQGDAYVKKIRECNDAIPGEEISSKISKLEKVVDKIFDRVEQDPTLVNDIRKLMEYYLPTTVKLLKAYIEMDSQPVQGENIETAKKEIEATLDTLNVAFEKLLDDLFQDAAWDVSSDISVLNTMLSQEGLKQDGLKK